MCYSEDGASQTATSKQGKQIHDDIKWKYNRKISLDFKKKTQTQRCAELLVHGRVRAVPRLRLYHKAAPSFFLPRATKPKAPTGKPLAAHLLTLAKGMLRNKTPRLCWTGSDDYTKVTLITKVN